MSEVISLADKLAKAKAKLGTVTPPAPPTPPVPPSAPKVTFMADDRSENDKLVDNAVERLDIIGAYNMYAHKGTVEAHGKTEGIKCSCPNPAHPDRNPSAWINTEKQTWFCGGCNEGGDKYDIAAWHFGLPVPGYKTGANFHELRRKIATDQGYTFQRLVGGAFAVIPPAVDPGSVVGPSGAKRESTPVVDPDGAGVEGVAGPTPESAGSEGDAGEGASVTTIPSAISVLEEMEDIELKWKPIVPAGTFLDVWMRQTTIDDVPEEYHFWNGMLAISMSLGRDATLMDFRPVYGNLFVCILGRTGSGKSKAKYYLDQLLELAMPYKADDPFSKGVLRAPGLASAEALIWMFKKEIEDPSKPKGSKPEMFPVRGIVDYNELSSMIGRTNRAGNVLMPTLMQFYDMEKTVETVSRTHGVERALEPYASAITTSQPKALRGLLTGQDAASGFLNRWFFAAGKEKKRSAIGGVIVDVSPAVKPIKEIQAWATTAGSIKWSQDAEDLFTTFFYNELQPVMRQDETDLLNRLDLFCKKLVLLFTANMKDKQVEIEAVEQMMKLYGYILECYGIPGAHVGSSLQNEIRDNVIKIVVDNQTKTGKGATLRDMNQRLKQKKYPLDLYNRTLKYMVEIEELIIMPNEPGPGRPTVRYGVQDLTMYAKLERPKAGRPKKAEAVAK